LFELRDHLIFGMDNQGVAIGFLSHDFVDPMVVRAAENNHVGTRVDDFIDNLPNPLFFHSILFNHSRPVATIRLNDGQALGIELFQ
jgi:hypothetical protein